jgi:hypothetical protein
VLDDAAAVGAALSKSAGHIPYYIHSLVARIRNGGSEIDCEAVRKCLDSLISDPDDPANFGYYESRLTTYYGDTEAELARHALDALASLGGPANFSSLLNLVSHKTPAAEEELFHRVLQVLQKDHYLIKNKNGTYAFRYSIVQTWWAHTRG